MKPRLPKSVLLPLAAGLVQILSGCLSSTSIDPDRSAGGSDEIDTRIAVDRTGRPVVGARIALVRADDSTGKPVALNATGKDGTFPNFAVPDGYYSVVLRDVGDSLGKYVDSLEVKNQRAPVGRDTLLALGNVRGVVRVSAGHSPATVTVGLLGTDIVANVKADGTFQIELVPSGLYTLGAFTSLDGYGPLYKRIQLKDGQNLTLPDTLVLPFTGLPSPGGLRVLQDTGTGNVRVSWNRVNHPDLLGYVLERVESGVVTTSRFLTDTVWTDSLGADWEAMPLLGPWPNRNLSYRLRCPSLSGGPDSKTVAQAITAKPPEWTKRVVPIRVGVKSEALANVRTFAWTPLSHPLFRDWVVERVVNGAVDCEGTTTGLHWSEAGCSVPGIRNLDSLINLGSMKYLSEEYGHTREYKIAARTISGRRELIWDSGCSVSDPSPHVVWKDSGIYSDERMWYGNWGVFWDNEERGYKFSKDGVNWGVLKIAPLQSTPYRFAALGDSLWVARLIDSTTIEVQSRIGDEKWDTLILSTPRKIGTLIYLTTKGGKLLVSGQLSYGEVWWMLDSNQLVPAEFVTFEGGTMGYRSYEETTIDGVPYQYCTEYGQFRVARNGIDVTRALKFRGELGVYGGIDGFGLLAYISNSSSGTSINYIFDSSGNSKVFRLNAPVKPKYIRIYKNELFLYGTDGHLWKGKLNLPK